MALATLLPLATFLLHPAKTGSVRVGGKNSKIVRWNDEVKPVVRRKDAAWKEYRAASVKRQKKDVWKFINKKRERLKGAYIMAKKKVN